MRLPRSVRVVDTEYAVVMKRGVVGDDGEPAYGYTSLDHTRIDIDRDASSERQFWAFVHEVSHAFAYESGLFTELESACGPDKARAIEEDMVRRFGPGLIATLRNAGAIK